MYTLRPATEADYDFLYALHCAAIREYVEPIWGWHEEWQAEYFRRKFNPNGRRVIEVEGHDAGVLVIEERPDELYLALIELLPGYQGRGIGTMIVTSLLDQAQNRGMPVTLDVLETNQPARRLYERLGFRLVGQKEHRQRMLRLPENEVENKA
ncbi:conserved protein of unknown function [Candidatus Promineifilum breve]|uniref:N-acetyltransferase domain-containing protein n=1 Tax=Candidatus Promineifilum breve TaxID=1806508 RepID=A0A160SZU5_9CHLR|nr:GNAT family N-acetyltransferase [Candidatus Promineifilum breve]CUS02269.2 conserved protein of unknown function [Candidatus Promineifilum breve]